MACQYGSEPKLESPSTYSYDPYAGQNPLVRIAYLAAGVPAEYTFNTAALCAIPAESFTPITYGDLLDVVALEPKVRKLAEHKSWYINCKCKPPTPPEPEPDPDPIEIPTPTVPAPPFQSPCGTVPMYPGGHFVVQARGWLEENKNVGTHQSRVYEFPQYQDVYVLKVSNDPPIYNIFDGSTFLGQIPSAGWGIGFPLEVRARFCEGSGLPPDDPPPETDQPDIEYPCPSTDCLTDVDKAEILSILQLYISESNNRIRDEINTVTLEAKAEIVSEIFWKTQQLDDLIRAQFLTDREQAIIDFQAIKDEINATEQLLQDWIDGAKNQILSSIAGTIAALGAGIFAAFTALTAALTATQTALAAAITAARTAIEGKVESEATETKSDLRKKMNAIAYKRLIVQTHVTVIPANASITSGRTGAPDKIAAGWLQFCRQRADGNTTYFERQFITNVYNRFVSPEPAEDMSYTVHTIAGYQITSSSIQGEFEDTES